MCGFTTARGGAARRFDVPSSTAGGFRMARKGRRLAAEGKQRRSSLPKPKTERCAESETLVRVTASGAA
jgi:hypothetical protein